MGYKLAAWHVRGGDRPRPGGFTLLEMLTVIIIIALLLTIGTPSVLRMQTIAQRSNSLRVVNLIDGACNSYKSDHDQFPPSTPGEGRVNLVRALVGYGNENEDGKAGLGFKVRPGGKVWGPYNGCENVDVSDAPHIFLDSFGNEIYYYRGIWQDGVFDGYNDGDNSDGPPGGIDLYAKDPGGKYFRKDFLLITKGPDGDWAAFRTESTTDDITNFLPED